MMIVDGARRALTSRGPSKRTRAIVRFAAPTDVWAKAQGSGVRVARMRLAMNDDRSFVRCSTGHCSDRATRNRVNAREGTGVPGWYGGHTVRRPSGKSQRRVSGCDQGVRVVEFDDQGTIKGSESLKSRINDSDPLKSRFNDSDPARSTGECNSGLNCTHRRWAVAESRGRPRRW